MLTNACAALPSTKNLSPKLAQRVEFTRDRAVSHQQNLEKELTRLRGDAARGLDDKRIILDDKRVKNGGSVGCDGVG